MQDPDRLYIAVRADLSPGLQIAQAVHAALAFAHEHPGLTEFWLKGSNYLIIVAVPDEDALYRLINNAHYVSIAHTGVREPDCGDTITAVALEPGPKARTLCANLPLALRQVAMT